MPSSQFFFTLDILSRYFQIPISENRLPQGFSDSADRFNIITDPIVRDVDRVSKSVYDLLGQISTGSTGITPAQHRYSVYELQLLGISYAAKQCEHYQQGSAHMVTFVADHGVLLNFPDIQLDKITYNHVLRSLEEMLSLNFEFAVTPGKQNGMADFLSRLPHSSSEAPDYPKLVPQSLFGRQGL